MLNPDTFPLPDHVWIAKIFRNIRHHEKFQIFRTDTTTLLSAWESILQRKPNMLGIMLEGRLLKYINKNITAEIVEQILTMNHGVDELLENLEDLQAM